MIYDMPNWIWVLWGSGYSDMSLLPHVTPDNRDNDDCCMVWMFEGMYSCPTNDNPTTADIIAWLSGVEVWY